MIGTYLYFLLYLNKLKVVCKDVVGALEYYSVKYYLYRKRHRILI